MSEVLNIFRSNILQSASKERVIGLGGNAM